MKPGKISLISPPFKISEISPGDGTNNAFIIGRMTFTEIFTIYLAVGAPFGVYYFFKNRSKLSDFALMAKSIATALLWFTVAARLSRQWIAVLKARLQDSRWDFPVENKIECVSQNILNIFAAISGDAQTISFFEFRETLERYVGLALAAQHSSLSATADKRELEIFRIAGSKQPALQIAGKAIHRKNYLRLKSHESMARHDFLQVCFKLKVTLLKTELNAKFEIWRNYQSEVIQLFELLKDAQAIQALLEHLETHFTKPPFVEVINKHENDIWITVHSTPFIKNFPVSASSQNLTSPVERLN